MVLAEIWLENRMRKARARRFKKAYTKVLAEGCATGFEIAWTASYDRGHRIAYAMGYDKYDAEAYALNFAESEATSQVRWEAWNRRRMDAESKGMPFDEPTPKPESR